MKKGDPGLETWASLDAARHGGAQAWVPGAYDPETNLYIFSTGNPTPAYTTGTRGEGDNLFTCALVAINVDTGKMAWYFSTSPHDMHDYDSAQTPVLVDAMFNGKMRKLVLTAARNGYYFTLDRVTGEHLVTSKYGMYTNWADGLNKVGRAAARSGERCDGRRLACFAHLRRHHQLGAAHLLSGYGAAVCGRRRWLLDVLPDRCGPARLHGPGRQRRGQCRDRAAVSSPLSIIGPAKVAWRHPYYGNGGGGGLLTTAGKLLFGADGAGNLVAHDVTNGKPLWHTRIGSVTNAPQTFMLDGHQYLIAATGDTVWAFTLY